MNDTLVSIIVPYYNGKIYINQLLDCTLNQTYKNIELLIVNDFSTDDSIEILKKKQNEDNRIKIINMPQKGGHGCKGIEEAFKQFKGEYFLILTQDDFIDKDYIEKCLKQAIKTNCKIVLSKAINYKSPKSKHEIGRIYKNGLSGKKAFELSLNWKIPNVGLRHRDILNQQTFVGSYYNADEYYFRKCLLNEEKIVFANTKFYYNKTNPNALTKQLTTFMFDIINTQLLITQDLINYNFSKRVIEKQINKLIKQHNSIWIKAYHSLGQKFTTEEKLKIKNTINNEKVEIERIIKSQNLNFSKLYLKFHKLEELQNE